MQDLIALRCLQVCNADFFLKTLPLFDSGDDVGMVLSPQCFHNVDVGADVFNHANVQFWEYAQTGYDALGFISCTGMCHLFWLAITFIEHGYKQVMQCMGLPYDNITPNVRIGMHVS